MANELNTSELKTLKEIVETLFKYKDAVLDALDAMNKHSESQKDAADKTQDLNEAQKQRIKLLDQLKKAQSNEAKALEEIKLEIQEQNKLNKQAAKEKKGLISAYDKESKQLNDLRKQYKDLAVQNKANSKEAKALLKNIDDLDSKLKDIDATVGQHQRSIGNYKSAIEDMPGPLGGVAQGFKGMAQAALKFIATPIGAVLAAIVGAVKLLGAAFKRSESSMNKVRVATASLKGIFDLLLKALKPVADFIGDTLIATFDALGSAVEKTVGFVGKVLGKLGFEQAAESVNNFATKIAEAATLSAELQKMQNKLNNELRFAEKIQLDYQKQAEKLRQIRDDESISIFERINANEKLGKVLKEQTDAELRIANMALAIAEKRIELEGDSTENLDARAEALTRISDIQERISGQESEQLVNINSLLRDKKAQLDEVYNTDKADAYFEQLKAENDAFTESLINEEADITNITEEEIQKRIEAAQRYYEAVKGFEDELKGQIVDNINGLFELRSAYRDSEIASLEKRRDYEVALAEEAGKSTAAIQEKYAKKEADLRRKQAIQDKIQSVFNASLSIAKSILKAIEIFGPPPSPAGITAISAASILGAIQLGTIVATPIPKFGYGSGVLSKDTLAQVGDRYQHEAILMPSGQVMFSDNKPQNVLLPSGSQVLSGEQTKEFVQDRGLNDVLLKKMIISLDTQTKIMKKQTVRTKDRLGYIEEGQNYINRYIRKR